VSLNDSKSQKFLSKNLQHIFRDDVIRVFVKPEKTMMMPKVKVYKKSMISKSMIIRAIKMCYGEVESGLFIVAE
jgi:preprotein translocase subunit SecA